MPPSIKKKLAAYAKSNGMSFSELVTILCVNYLDAIGESQELLDSPKDTGKVVRKVRKTGDF